MVRPVESDILTRVAAALELERGAHAPGGIQGSGNTLSWFNTYLTDRNYFVSLGGDVSKKRSILYGVPQGLILGPLLFSLYMNPLGEMIRDYRIHFHCYADDTQLYLSVAPDNKDALHPLLNCFSSIVQWMN